MRPDQQPSDATGSLEEELLRLLARQGRRVPIPIFLAAFMIAAMAYGRIPALLLAGWLLLVAAVLAARWVVLGRLPALTAMPARKRLRIAVALSAMNGITHGLSLAFFPFLPPYERAIQSMLLVVACTGSVATTAGYRPVFLAYVLPTLGPLVVLWALSPGMPSAGWIEISTSGVFVLTGLILVALAGDAFRLFRESFEIRLQQAELNRQLRTALDQAEAANRAKTRFLASASHDLRQPIHTLSLFGAALAMRPLERESREIAKHMNTALQSLASQLDALLDISKLDAGVVRVNRGPATLRPILERLHEEFAPRARGKGLRMDLECPREALVDIDPLLLERILRNLLDNAVKYTASGAVALRAQRTPGGYDVTVSDTGRGIPEAEQPRVFEEFYQLDNPERDRTKGLGLGLAIVTRLADLMRIKMHMSSTPGRGTQFVLTVPEATSGAAHTPEPAAAAAPLGALHVLVVDDEAAIRIGMKTLLEAMGCRATLADGTASALAAARADEPDLVVADLRLRGGDDGFETVRAIRKLYPRLRAILISGDIAAERLREAEAAGIPLLHKPVPFEILKREIAQGT
jgi:signal transduction histidine kinase